MKPKLTRPVKLGRPTVKTEKNLERVAKLWNAGLTMKEIGKVTELGHGSIVAIIKELSSDETV